MDIGKIKKTIEASKTVENLWKIGEKIFAKNDDAVCTVTYLIDRAYMLGKQDKDKIPNDKSNPLKHKKKAGETKPKHAKAAEPASNPDSK